MQTRFTEAQLVSADTRAAEPAIRKCVHCGFCLATCPTYLLLGDERDSPRGRIYLMRDMLEGEREPTQDIVRHLDRCLSCLACMTTCPSGVNYMHLIDHARAYIEDRYRRPWTERALRGLLAWLLPHPARFRLALLAAGVTKPLVQPLAPLLPARLRAMLELAPARLPPPSPVDAPQRFEAEGPRRMRVALLTGCAQQVVAPAINEATIRLLTRHGCEVVVAKGAGCCGALVHHLGRHAASLEFARANIAAWGAAFDEDGLDAVVVNASGCGTHVKDYGFLLREDAAWAAKAARISALARDIGEVIAALGLQPPAIATGQRVAYHDACSLQHGQRVQAPPRALLKAAGFEVVEVPEGHICCGSAGTYNLLQPEIAGQLRARKAANIASVEPDIVAAGNVGCIAQIAGGTAIPVLHTVELLDWATGGPLPGGLGAAAIPPP